MLWKIKVYNKKNGTGVDLRLSSYIAGVGKSSFAHKLKQIERLRSNITKSLRNYVTLSKTLIYHIHWNKHKTK